MSTSEREEPYEVYIDEPTLHEIVAHCRRLVPVEAIGFLVGELARWEGRSYIFVKACIEGTSQSTRSSVEFAPGALAEAITILRKEYPGTALVGWYHSHPGYRCFLSRTDVQTQKACFQQPCHVALVVDPVNNQFEFFKVDETSSGYMRASFCIVRKTPENSLIM